MKTPFIRASIIFLSIFHLSISLNGQNLTTSIQQIKQNHDLMGGVVVVFCKDQILESIPFGTADYQRSIQTTDSTMYRIASISKTITAIAIMQLCELGYFQLDTDIGDILGYQVRNPNYPSQPITVRMLLSHTSSIIDGSTYSNFLTATYNNSPIPNLSELLSPGGTYYTSGQFINYQPGTYFTYSNVNFGILGTIIEKVSSQRFDVYCRQHILEPMEIAGSFNVNDIADINHIAVLYRKTGGVWAAQADNYQGIQPVFSNLTGYIPGTNGFRFAPQGGLRVSGDDLAKIFMLFLNEGIYETSTILQPGSVDSMLNTEWAYNGSNGNNYYGLFRSWGLGIHRTTNTSNNDIVLPGSTQMFGHPGEAYGLVSDAYVDTLRKTGIIFITNGCGTGYSTNSSSAFYTVETDIFNAIENYGNPGSCITLHSTGTSQSSAYQVYPNPFSSYIAFETGSTVESVHKIRVYNQTGSMVKEFNSGDAFFQISTEQFPAGIWFIDINNTYQIRLIKSE